MAKSNTASEDAVTSLLAERNQVQVWITRLDSTKDTTPSAVRSKVLSDYQVRLDQVLKKLSEHGDTVRAQLEQRKGRKEEILIDEARAKETLAEAELRHAVGEYDEGDWTKVRAESNKSLVALREELAKVVEDIERLAEVAKLIAAPPAPEPPAKSVAGPPKAAPAAEPADATAAGSQKWETGRAEFVPSAVKAKPPADELEFLRATVGEAEAAPLPRTTKIEKEKRPRNEPAATSVSTSAPAVAAPEEDALPEPKGTPEVRTLKCPECGTMNRPTEWYCERCGSELAGV